MWSHISRAPDASMLPPGEQHGGARAPAKRPDGRWPSCQGWGRGLAAAGGLGEPLPVGGRGFPEWGEPRGEEDYGVQGKPVFRKVRERLGAPGRELLVEVDYGD